LKLERELVDNDLDFVAALGFANSVPTKPCIFGANPDIEAWGKLPWWHIITDYPVNQRFKVLASGFGMVLMTRRMLDKMVTTTKGELFEMPEGFEHLGAFVYPGSRNEDVAFCLRAQQAGIDLWCDSRVCIGHISKDRPVITEQTYRDQGNAAEYHLGMKRAAIEDGHAVWADTPNPDQVFADHPVLVMREQPMQERSWQKQPA
jgi:hypothetical protein